MIFDQNQIIQFLEERIRQAQISNSEIEDYLDEIDFFQSAITEIKSLSSKYEDLLTSLRYASGIISTMPQYAMMHPEDVFDYLVNLYKELLNPPD
jgi:hypothetical protein